MGSAGHGLRRLIIIAKNKAGEILEAEKDLENFSKVIVRNGHVHETYFLDGRPFDHPRWKSAVPFAWGAGLFLWAVTCTEIFHLIKSYFNNVLY